MNAVQESSNRLDLIMPSRSEADRLFKYLPFSPAIFQGITADSIRLTEVLAMFRDFDKPFKQFMDECRFTEISRAAGLKMKARHTIIEPWPMRLKENATQDEFNTLHASSHVGSERYVEWETRD